jgi:hypothetical protein
MYKLPLVFGVVLCCAAGCAEKTGELTCVDAQGKVDANQASCAQDSLALDADQYKALRSDLIRELILKVGADARVRASLPRDWPVRQSTTELGQPVLRIQVDDTHGRIAMTLSFQSNKRLRFEGMPPLSGITAKLAVPLAAVASNPDAPLMEQRTSAGFGAWIAFDGMQEALPGRYAHIRMGLFSIGSVVYQYALSCDDPDSDNCRLASTMTGTAFVALP